MAIPKFHDERLALLPEKYFLAVGHLQYAYTTLEVAIASHLHLIVTAGYDPQDHRFLFDRIYAVMGGMRMDAAKDAFKRLLRVIEAPPEVAAYVGGLFSQLSEIQWFRNRLTHYQTGRWPRKRGLFINSDVGLAREDAKVVTFAFGYDALDAARHDLHAIILYLDQAVPAPGDPVILAPPAWQYKPSMLVRSGQ